MAFNAAVGQTTPLNEGESRPVLDGDTSRKAIGVRLRATRLALGYANASEFARLIGLSSPAALFNYETGRRRPDLSQAFMIARKTGVTLDWIYFGDESGLPQRIARNLPPPDEAQRA